MWKCKEHNSKNNFENKGINGEIILSVSYYFPTTIKRLRYWFKDAPIDQLKRINLEIDPHIYDQSIVNKNAKVINVESTGFLKTGIRTTRCPCGGGGEGEWRLIIALCMPKESWNGS